MSSRATAGTETGPPRLGDGWATLARELQERLHVIDAEAVVSAHLDGTGLLRFELRAKPSAQDRCAKLVARYESRAAETCETCGSPGRLYAGVVVTVRCSECAGAP